MKMQSNESLVTPLESLKYLPVSRLAQTRRSVRLLAMFLAGLLGATVLALIVVPWQQTSTGIGKVVARNPIERQQVLSAPVKGRVVKWHVTEGSLVKKGQLIAQMSDNDPQALQRIQEQRSAILEQGSLAKQQASSYRSKIEALKKTRKLRMQANQLKIRVAWQKLQANKQKLNALQASLRTAQINYKRSQRLSKEAIISKRSLEVAELKVARLRAKINAAKAAVTAARSEVYAAKAVRLKKSAEDQAKIDSASAEYQKAKNKAAYTRSEIAKVELKMARQASQVIRASRDVVVVRLLVTQDSEMLKAGDPIALIIPKTQRLAVELWVDGFDVPLLTKGREVRLQFEGWPAVQFAGWPSVAVGTFGGRISIIDSTNSKNGKFRIVVIPDPKDSPWPKAPFLLQGMKAKGWIFLNQVRLGYELWRQLNSFPPSFDRPLQGEKPHKKPKKR